MFGKLKNLLKQVEMIWEYLDAHKEDIAQLQKDVKATQATLKKLTPPTPPKKTTK
jgi:peptidoglycan hydrolase CwlO-like protein